MVLRKPYALLIKHFRLIHIILSLLMIYSTIKMRNIYKFFVNYISSGWLSINSDEVSSYVNATCYISVILVLLILGIVFWLMNIKKKKNLYYKIAIPAYIVSLISFNVLSHILFSATTEIISPLNLRIYRDISLIMFIVQAALLIVPILRGIGFDVKKFNFKKDIADLHIDDIDSEEVELNINIDKNKIRRNINRFGRNSSYIFLRNKIIIFRILLIGAFVSLGYFSYNVFIVNRIYSENTVVKLDKYSIKVNKSYLTNLDSNGNIINNGYKYIVVDFTPINNIEDNTFNMDKVDIKINDKSYYPDTTSYTYFKDIGYGYNNQKLGTDNKLDYVMVFKIPMETKVRRVLLRYINGSKNVDGNIIRSYKNIRLKLNNDTKNIMNINSNLGSNININNNTFKIDSYDINQNFEYTYKNCYDEENCEDINKKISPANYGYWLLKLTGEFKLENKGISMYYNNYADYFSPMIYIRYKINNESKKVVNLVSITPTKVIENNKELYLEVPEEMTNASEISLHLKYRNVDYNIKLK